MKIVDFLKPVEDLFLLGNDFFLGGSKTVDLHHFNAGGFAGHGHKFDGQNLIGKWCLRCLG